ncbi:MAG: hypothetical protein SFZ02_17725, partial [bacterium]|nr:hypothetical protein [bacterium]
LRSARDRARKTSTIEVANLPQTIVSPTPKPSAEIKPSSEEKPSSETPTDAPPDENIGARLLQRKRQPKDSSS